MEKLLFKFVGRNIILFLNALFSLKDRELLIVDIGNLDVDVDMFGLNDDSKLTQVCSGFLNHIIGKRIQSKEFWQKMVNFS